MLQRDMNMGRSSRSSQGSVASLARLDADRATTDDNSDDGMTTAAEIARRPCEPAQEDLRRWGVTLGRARVVRRLGIGASFSRRTLPSRHCQRLPENSKVQPEAPVAYVPQVRLDALLHEIDGRSLAAEAIHLSPPADAGFHVISKCVVCHDPLIFGVVGDRMRPRPNQRHAAAEHIEELRQLVDARSPQPATHVGDARIVAGGLGESSDRPRARASCGT
jgi:hypothetical protein